MNLITIKKHKLHTKREFTLKFTVYTTKMKDRKAKIVSFFILRFYKIINYVKWFIEMAFLFWFSFL